MNTNFNENCSYRWKGIKTLSEIEINRRLETGDLIGCYLLYPDGTKSLVEENTTKEDIYKHYNRGGEFGVEKAINLRTGRDYDSDNESPDMTIVRTVQGKKVEIGLMPEELFEACRQFILPHIKNKINTSYAYDLDVLYLIAENACNKYLYNEMLSEQECIESAVEEYEKESNEKSDPDVEL